jgi:hypothetical protein
MLKTPSAARAAKLEFSSFPRSREWEAGHGATLDHVVQETIYVIDVDAAFTVAGPVRKAAYGKDRPECASTLAGVTRLAFPEQLVEISFTAVFRLVAGQCTTQADMKT